MNLNKYSYSHKKAFIKDHLDHWKMMNFKGEVYEASFYEKKAAEIDNNCSSRFLLAAKGPYSPDSTGSIKRGAVAGAECNTVIELKQAQHDASPPLLS